MRRFLLLMLFAACMGIAGSLFAFEFHAPTVDVNVTMQAQRFGGDEFGAFGGYADGPIDRYSLRHATIGLEGGIGERVEFEFRAGSATCFAGGAFTLLDAAAYYRPTDFLRFGFKKGEILRGFEFYEECVKVLTAEKPRFAKTFAPCHPTGAVVEIEHDFDEVMGISAEIAYLDGQSQNLDDEHDLNVGFQFRTPLRGLAVGGFFSAIRKNYGPGSDFEQVNDSGTRFGVGFDFERYNLALRSEYYRLQGFYNDPFNNTLYEDNSDPSSYIESADLEMNAFYVEAGYMVATNWEQVPFAQPYIRYQSWDKAANADGDHTYTYLTTGISLFLDENRHTMLRVDYEDSMDTPDGASEDASLLIIRLQVDFDWTPGTND